MTRRPSTVSGPVHSHVMKQNVASPSGFSTRGFLLFVPYVLCSLAAGMGTVGFPFEILSNLRPQLFVAGVGLAALLVVLQAHRLLIFVSLGAALVHGSVVAVASPFLQPLGERTQSAPSLQVLWSNLHGQIEELDVIRRLSLDRDVLVLTEIPTLSLDALEESMPGFALVAITHHLASVRNLERRRSEVHFCGMDVGVLVRREKVQVVRSLPIAGATALKVELLDRSGQPVTLIAAHPGPAIGPSFLSERNLVFDRLQELAPSDQAFVVVGDFNITPWAPDYERLPGRRAGDPRLAPTWFSRIPGLGLPIDHVLLGNGLAFTNARVEGSEASDHFPLKVDIVHPSGVRMTRLDEAI